MATAGEEKNGDGRKRQFLVHIDPDLKRRVKVLAAQREISASSIVQEAIQRYLEDEAPQDAPG